MMAAPAIVHAGNLMPVRAVADWTADFEPVNWAELVRVTRMAFIPRLYGGTDFFASVYNAASQHDSN
jgi:hypothetical protein